MKVCTVLVSATSKRPIKLLSHADRQKSDGEHRMVKGTAQLRGLPQRGNPSIKRGGGGHEGRGGKRGGKRIKNMLKTNCMWPAEQPCVSTKDLCKK